MSKGIGQKIAVQFTEELSGDVGAKTIKQYIRPEGIFSASNTVGGYPVTNAFDGDINTFWYNYWGGNAQWIQVRLPVVSTITGFRWRNVLNNRPKGFKFQGSANGSTWVDILIGESPNIEGWQIFEFETAFNYEYFRWTFTSYYNSYIQLLELQLQMLVGNEAAFKLTGQQFKYIKGPLVDMNYKIVSVAAHPTEPKTLSLTLHPQSRFPTVEGALKLEYDATVGNLAGRGGSVESFVNIFTPIGLSPEPNPNVEETITVAPVEITANFIPVEYLSGYGEETINVSPVQVTATLIHTSIINP